MLMWVVCHRYVFFPECHCARLYFTLKAASWLLGRCPSSSLLLWGKGLEVLTFVCVEVKPISISRTFTSFHQPHPHPNNYESRPPTFDINILPPVILK